MATKKLRPSINRRHVVRPGSAFGPVVVAAGDEKRSWDLGKFVQTWQFFNEPFNFGKVKLFLVWIVYGFIHIMWSFALIVRKEDSIVGFWCVISLLEILSQGCRAQAQAQTNDHLLQ